MYVVQGDCIYENFLVSIFLNIFFMMGYRCRAFDGLEGIEVAWNWVKVSDLLRHLDDMEHLCSAVHLLKILKHKNNIKFYNSWIIHASI